MIIFIIKEIVMSLVIIGLMTTIGIILYPWTELVVSSWQNDIKCEFFETRDIYLNSPASDFISKKQSKWQSAGISRS